MSAPTFEEGDTLKTPSGKTEIESIDGRMVTLGSGKEVGVDGIKQGLHTGQLDLIPAGTGERDTYIRFGDIPEDERSYDSRNDRQEAGVSVYACERDTTDEDAPADIDEAYYLAGTMLQTVFGMLHRPVYLVSGERVGTGADGEPVIRDVEIEGELRTPEGVGGFVEAE
jgi:hypothetical protein